MGGATIHLTLHGTTTGSTNKVTCKLKWFDGDFDRAVTLVPGHSYTVDAKYDGDSDHQPASATASINIPGSTGSTQNTSNAGSGQQNNISSIRCDSL